jgi:hypothetical protein
MFVYGFPAILGIPPHRYKKTSRVELAFDILLTGGWISAATRVMIYSRCPAQIRLDSIRGIIQYIDHSTEFCPALVITVCLGYISGLFYFMKIIQGLKNNEEKVKKVGKNIMFARGNWRRLQ